MTTETKTENTATPETSDNKAVFGPLGKYAIVAVIMVSIIVTTAIMLDRQLKTVDQQIAAIEEEVADMHAADTTASDEAVIAELIAAESAPVSEAEIKQAEVKQETASETVAVQAVPESAPVATPVVAKAAETPTAVVLVVQEATTATEVAKTEQEDSATAAQFKMAAVKDSAQARQEKMAQENQARIEAYKLEQKQHMTEVFARIKTLESQQLDRYKANQDGQVVRLREQIAQQQQMIETLVSRNKKLFELRAASMQRNQTNREQALNRI